MKGARLSRKAVQLVGNDSVDAIPVHRSRTLPIKLGIMVLIASLNSAFWTGTVLAVGIVAGYEVGTHVLSGVGVATLLISAAGLSLMMFERR